MLPATVARAVAAGPTDRARTPTAEAAHLRFNKTAARKASWKGIVAAALLQDRTMWLAALERGASGPSHPRSSATPCGVSRANAGGGSSAARATARRVKLIAADEPQWGKHGLLDQALPTVNQIDGQHGFTTALAIAGLHNPAPAGDPQAPTSPTTPPETRGRRDAPPVQCRGQPPASAMAVYGALNDKWPSPTTLIAFARACGFALADISQKEAATGISSSATAARQVAAVPCAALRCDERSGLLTDLEPSLRFRPDPAVSSSTRIGSSPVGGDYASGLCAGRSRIGLFSGRLGGPMWSLRVPAVEAGVSGRRTERARLEASVS